MNSVHRPNPFVWFLAITLAFGVLAAGAGDWAEWAFRTALLLGGALLLQTASARARATPPPIVLLPVAAAAAWGVVQIACGWSEYPFASWNSAASWLSAAAATYLGYVVLSDTVTRQRAGTAFVLSGFVVSVAAILQWYTGEGRIFWVVPTKYADGVVGPFLNRDQYAAFVELVLPFALHRAFSHHQGSLWYAAISAMMLASVIATGSRAGSAIATAEVIGFCAIAVFKAGRAGARVAGAVLAAGVTLTLAAGWEFLWLRLQADDQLGLRRHLYRSSVEMVKDRPLTGFGLGCWPEVYPAYALFDNGTFVHHAHNDWLEWAGEGGLPLVALVVAFAVVVTRHAARHRWGLGVPAVFLHGLLDFPLHKAALAALVFVMAGALAAAVREDSQLRPRTRGIP